MPGKITYENVDRVFGSEVAPDSALPAMKLVADRFAELAKTVISNVPDCAHRSAALRDILVAKWACIDAIVKGGLV